MPELVKIRPELFEKLHSAFLHDDDPLSDERDWQNVFIYQWDREEDYHGYALLNDDHVIGMIAMAFRPRLIDGESYKFCNLHTWWVHEDYRGHSVSMLRPLQRLKGYNVTHFTPCDRVRALAKRLGFVDLDMQMKVLMPLSWMHRRSLVNKTLEMQFDEEIDPTELDEPEASIFHDHQPYRVGHLLLRDGLGSCYILYTHVVRYRVNYCHIHYVSDQEFFLRNEPLVRNALMQRHKVRFVVVDARRYRNHKFRRSFNFWTPGHALFRPSDELEPHQIDNLYSDVVMLRLATLPHVSYEVKRMLQKWNPFRKTPSID